MPKNEGEPLQDWLELTLITRLDSGIDILDSRPPHIHLRDPCLPRMAFMEDCLLTLHRKCYTRPAENASFA